MTATALLDYRSFDLPWNSGSPQERRFRRIVAVTLALTTLLALLISLLPLREPVVVPLVEVPVEMLQPLPPPPEVKPQPKPEPRKPDPVKVKETPKPQEPPKPTPQPPKPTPPQPSARDRAQQAMGAVADDLASLRESTATDAVANADATINNAASQSTSTQRAMITSQAGKASGGVSTQSLNRGAAGGSLADRGATQVAGAATGGGVKSRAGTGAGDSAGSRSREEIELVFDRNKGSLYALYTRALRANPALQGKVVLELTIEPDGSVSAVKLVSSELGDPDLEAKLVAKVRSFRFEAKNVSRMTTTKPLDFFPS